MKFIMVEDDLLWDAFEFRTGQGLGSCLGELLMRVCQCLIVGDGRAEMALVFSEGNFPIHSFDDFIIVDLLLYVEFGEFG